MENPFDDLFTEEKVESPQNEPQAVVEEGKQPENLEATREALNKAVQDTPAMKILKAYNLVESDIPINSAYWKMKK